MTVSALNSYDSGLGNGAAKTFPFSFRCQGAADVDVYLSGVKQAIGFLVTVNANGVGGNVTFDTAPANGIAVLIRSDPAFSMTTKFEDAGPYLGSSHDDVNDAAAVRDIYLKGEAERSIKAPIGETLADLPSKANRVGKFAAFDANGDPVASVGTGSDTNLRTDLAATSGAALSGYIGTGVGAVSRTIQSKLRDTVNVKDFGAVGNGIADDTAAIQAAINAVSGGGEVVIPNGTYKITDTLTVSGQAVRLRGYGAFATKLDMTALNKPILLVTGDHFNFSGFSTHYTGGTPVAGASAITISAVHVHGDNFLVRNAWDGITITAASDVRLSSFAVLDYEDVGVFVHDTALDVYVSKFYLNCGVTTRGALGGIRLYNRCEAVVFTDGEVLQGVYPITFAAAANTAGARPAYSKFSNIYFDSAANAAQINNCAEIDFISCWFSNRPGNGVSLQTVDGVRFTGGGAINNGGHGVTIAATAVRVVFNGFSARGNGTNGANTCDGINVAAGASDFLITGCTLGGSISFGTQRYGVNVVAGASDRYIVADNLVSGNGTGGVSDNGSGANKRVANNY